MKKTILLLVIGLSAFALIGCASTTIGTDTNSANVNKLEVPKISVGSTYNFLGTPIHIGDGEGSTEDIESNYSKYWKNNPAQQASWEFKLDGSPASARLLINVYSIEGKGQYDCPTILELNGKKILDFRKLPGAGFGKTVKADISVQPRQLKNGHNKITVREVECSGSNDAWNDSVITSVILRRIER